MRLKVRLVRHQRAIFLNREDDRSFGAMTGNCLGSLGASAFDHFAEPGFCLLNLPGRHRLHVNSVLTDQNIRSSSLPFKHSESGGRPRPAWSGRAGGALRQAIAVLPGAFERTVRGRVPWMRPEDHAHMLEGLRKAGWQG